MPTTEAGKRLAAELGVAYRIALIDAAESEARDREDVRLAEAVRRIDLAEIGCGDECLWDLRDRVLALLEEPDYAND